MEKQEQPWFFLKSSTVQNEPTKIFHSSSELPYFKSERNARQRYEARDTSAHRALCFSHACHGTTSRNLGPLLWSFFTRETKARFPLLKIHFHLLKNIPCQAFYYTYFLLFINTVLSWFYFQISLSFPFPLYCSAPSFSRSCVSSWFSLTRAYTATSVTPKSQPNPAFQRPPEKEHILICTIQAFSSDLASLPGLCSGSSAHEVLTTAPGFSTMFSGILAHKS